MIQEVPLTMLKAISLSVNSTHQYTLIHLANYPLNIFLQINRSQFKTPSLNSLTRWCPMLNLVVIILRMLEIMKMVLNSKESADSLNQFT